jgi:hypothetical protein
MSRSNGTGGRRNAPRAQRLHQCAGSDSATATTDAGDADRAPHRRAASALAACAGGQQKIVITTS